MLRDRDFGLQSSGCLNLGDQLAFLKVLADPLFQARRGDDAPDGSRHREAFLDVFQVANFFFDAGVTGRFGVDFLGTRAGFQQAKRRFGVREFGLALGELGLDFRCPLRLTDASSRLDLAEPCLGDLPKLLGFAELVDL